MDGILNVYKEPGYTSFDVVAKMRGILKQKKIGHTGTLDPAAEGVLPVCVGTATKLCEMLTDGTKTYEAVLLLGTVTDTFDMEGQVEKTCPVFCTPEEVSVCINSFLGEQEQIPPMYSALKVNGKKLYELARQGVTVERKPRKVCFYELEIQDMYLPRVRIKIRCSKGTYIRSLCSDIGERLGCGGCMESLKRTASGGFTAETAHRLSEIEELVRSGRIGEILIPMDKVFENIPGVAAPRYLDKIVRNGGKISADQIDDLVLRKGGPGDIRLYDSEKNFIGIYGYSPDNETFYPKKILYRG